MDNAKFLQAEEINQLNRMQEKKDASDPIKTKFEKDLKELKPKAVTAKKQVSFEPPKPKEAEISELLKELKKPKVKKQIVEGESLFYSQSGATVLRPVLKQ